MNIETLIENYGIVFDQNDLEDEIPEHILELGDSDYENV